MGLRFVVVLLATVPREGWSGCDNNECISYNAYVYRTLDGANPNGGGANKQEEWLPALDGWDLCRGDADCKTVALSYGWGCHRIVGSVPTLDYTVTRPHPGSGLRRRHRPERGGLCQVNWTEISEGNLSNFSVMISHAELDACHFEVNATEASSLVVLETQTTETSWVFLLSIYLPREIHAFYGLVTKAQVVMGDVVVYAPGFDSALLLYESGAFSAPKSSSIYMAQERAFAELTLGSYWASRKETVVMDMETLNPQPSKRAPPETLEVEAVWLALTSDPAEPSVHNLTDSLQLISSQPGLARFSVQLKACSSCFLHVLASISRRLSLRSRRLRAIHALESVKITVNEQEVK
eukprot:s5633_g4.t4